MAQVRIATFNLENLDSDVTDSSPALPARIPVLRQALQRLDADVLCLQEVHGQKGANPKRELLALDEVLTGTQYAGFNRLHTLTKDDPQPYRYRNLVVLSRFVLSDRQQIMNDDVKPEYRLVTEIPRPREAKPVEWERPILYVKVAVAGRTLHVINLHLKSKLPINIEGQMIDQYTWKNSSAWAEASFVSSMKRVGQALETRMLIDRIFDQEADAWIAVCGDFNADFDEVPLAAIRGPVEETGNPALVSRVLVPCENTIPEPARYSLFHLGRGQMLDHVLVSRALLPFYRGAEIHNEVLPDESGAFRTDKKFPESDHAPVVATFDMPA